MRIYGTFARGWDGTIMRRAQLAVNVTTPTNSDPLKKCRDKERFGETWSSSRIA